eukprot:UN33936
MNLDMLLLLGTVLFIFCYMAFTSGSWFLASNGMYMIFMNFIPAILIYSLVFQIKYFGILQYFSVFLILAVGADDVFVLLDTWGQVNNQYWRDKTLAQRLTYALRDAGKVMLTTSLSTFFPLWQILHLKYLLFIHLVLSVHFWCWSIISQLCYFIQLY